MKQVEFRGFTIEEKDLRRLYDAFRPYKKEYGLELGFEKFFEEHTKFCIESGSDGIEAFLLFSGGALRRRYDRVGGRYVEREHTGIEWEDKKRYYYHRCFYCGNKKELTIDHMVPIIQGGSDRIDNIVPCCWWCNRNKRAKSMELFLNELNGEKYIDVVR